MIQLSTLNEWLQQPAMAAQPDAQNEIGALLKAYPYFTPAHMLSAVAAHSTTPFAPDMLARMQLHSVNWLLFYQMLTRQNETAAPADATVVTTAPADMPQQEETTPVAETAQHEEILHNKVHELVETIEQEPQTGRDLNNEPLIQPVFTEDYFLHQGITVPEEIPASAEQEQDKEKDKSLMVVMSFSEWLMFFKKKNDNEKEEEADKRALKSMWQKEKLAAAIEEENDEIPETVFEMAVNSIAKEEGLISESLAEILIRQGKLDKAVEMYRKLSLRNPQKNTYFAHKIEAILKEKKS